MGKVLKFFTIILFSGKFLIAQEPPSTATKNVHLLDSVFQIPGLERSRQIRIYLPPNYDQSKKSYPVLYMHDGQNLFDKSTAFINEWGVDEILDQMYERRGFELIVVGIDNGQSDRIHELTAWDHQRYGKAEGKEYMGFIVDVVKPFIDGNYRTKTKRRHTAIMGSSLGGLITHYAIIRYPEVFSKAGILSPSYWWGEGPFEQLKETGLPPDTRLYLLMGGKEGQQMLNSYSRMIELLEGQGYSQQIKHKMNTEGEHNERFWNAEFKEVVQWLFAK